MPHWKRHAWLLLQAAAEPKKSGGYKDPEDTLVVAKLILWMIDDFEDELQEEASKLLKILQDSNYPRIEFFHGDCNVVSLFETVLQSLISQVDSDSDDFQIINSNLKRVKSNKSFLNSSVEVNHFYSKAAI